MPHLAPNQVLDGDAKQLTP